VLAFCRYARLLIPLEKTAAFKTLNVVNTKALETPKAKAPQAQGKPGKPKSKSKGKAKAKAKAMAGSVTIYLPIRCTIGVAMHNAMPTPFSHRGVRWLRDAETILHRYDVVEPARSSLCTSVVGLVVLHSPTSKRILG
jgi:hypothetical protein